MAQILDRSDCGYQAFIPAKDQTLAESASNGLAITIAILPVSCGCA